MKQSFVIWSEWNIKHYRADGSLLAETIDRNTVTDEGINDMLNVLFHSGTQKTAWKVLIYSTNTTPSGSTTYATPVFTEVTTKYTEASRPAATFAAASGKSITNSANPARFTFNDSVTVYGGALVGGGTAAGTKGDTAGGGVMACAAKYASEKVMSNGEYLDVTVTVSMASA
jgi:hypothetical protein